MGLSPFRAVLGGAPPALGGMDDRPPQATPYSGR